MVWGAQIEGGVRRIEEHVRRFGTMLPIVVIVMERFALDQAHAVEAREHVEEFPIQRMRLVRPQGGTFDKRPNGSESHEVVTPDAFILTPAEEDDKVALSERVSDIRAAHAPARFSDISQ